MGLPALGRTFTGRLDGYRGVLAAVAVAVLAVVGAVLVSVAVHGSPGPPQPASAAGSPSPTAGAGAAPSPPASTPTSPSPSSSASAPVTDFGPVLDRSTPVRVRIPAISVDAGPLADLALDSHGELAAPKDFGQVGWYADGPAPGQLGPAVLAGHVDSKAGPAVFFKLGALRPGEAVLVTRADGTIARFVVDKVARYAKADFPTAAVYGSASHRAELRLVTCGGAFNHRTGHYLDNVVVYAHLVVGA